jgi:chitinase
MDSRGWFAGSLLAVVLGPVLVFGPTDAGAAQRDRTPPTAPADLVITAFTSYTVSLAWRPATDNSGSFSYRLTADGWGGGTVTLPQTATSHELHLLAGYKYSISLRAVDAAGNTSPSSNTVSVTLPADRTAPSAPVLSVTGVTASTVSLAWEPSVDDGSYISYQVLINGGTIFWAGGTTSALIQGLEPATEYTFAVQGRDNWQNWSPLSNTVTVTTDPANPNDHTPPTPPTNLTASDYDCEVVLRWTQSTDDSDPQSVIRYEVFVNGRLDHAVIGTGRTVVYGDGTGLNEFTVVAVDVAGNRSDPASIMKDLFCQF